MHEPSPPNTTPISFGRHNENRNLSEDNPSQPHTSQSDTPINVPVQSDTSQSNILPNDPTRPGASDRDEAQRPDAPKREPASVEIKNAQAHIITKPDEPARPVAANRDQTQPDDLVTVHEAVELFRTAGVERSIRTVQKYCSPQRKGRALKCHVTPTENGVRYMIERSSIDDFVREAGAQVPVGKSDGFETDVAASVPESIPVKIAVDDLAVYDHPYVKRLEQEVEKKDTKFDDLQIRYENAMDMAQNRLVELQQASAVAQSESLGKFMLEAKRIDQGELQQAPDTSQTGDRGDVSSTPPIIQPNPMSTSPQSEHGQQ